MQAAISNPTDRLKRGGGQVLIGSDGSIATTPAAGAQVTWVPPTGAAQTAGAHLFGSAGATYTNGAGAVTSLVRLNGQFAGTAADSTSAHRALTTEVHWVDSTNGASTFAGGYFFVYHDGAGTDVQDLFGVIGRAYITSTGLSSVGMWGVRGDVNFTGAANVSGSCAAVICHQGSWSAAATVAQYAGLQVTTHTLNTGGVVVTNGYGALVGVPTNATGHNVGVFIGDSTDIIAGAIGSLGLYVANRGAWIRGQMAIPYADTTNVNATMALYAGTHAGANDNLVALYFYRGATALGFIGYDSNVANVLAGHTKALTDLVIVNNSKLVVDSNGQIFCANQIASNSYLISPAIKASGTFSTSFTYTGAAHTGLTPGSAVEFNFNAARTIAYDNTGGTIATLYTFQFQAPTYTAAAALAITAMATVRITGAPAVSAVAGATPTFTTSWALLVSAGRSSFGGQVVFVASASGASGYASVNLPHGAAPTTNIADGDIWTTTAGLFCRINGVTKTVTLT